MTWGGLIAGLFISIIGSSVLLIITQYRDNYLKDEVDQLAQDKIKKVMDRDVSSSESEKIHLMTSQIDFLYCKSLRYQMLQTLM